jgi:hypothetical protein
VGVRRATAGTSGEVDDDEVGASVVVVLDHDARAGHCGQRDQQVLGELGAREPGLRDVAILPLVEVEVRDAAALDFGPHHTLHDLDIERDLGDRLAKAQGQGV